MQLFAYIHEGPWKGTTSIYIGTFNNLWCGMNFCFVAEDPNKMNPKFKKLYVSEIHLPRRVRYMHKQIGKGLIGVYGFNQLKWFQTIFPFDTVVEIEKSEDVELLKEFIKKVDQFEDVLRTLNSDITCMDYRQDQTFASSSTMTETSTLSNM